MTRLLSVAAMLLLISPVFSQGAAVQLERWDGTISNLDGSTTFKFTWAKSDIGPSYHDVEDHRFEAKSRLYLDGVQVRAKDFCLPQHPVRVMTLWQYHRDRGIYQLLEVRATTR